MELYKGIKGYDRVTVTEENVARALGSGALPVFSTPSLIISMERASIESVNPYLDEGTSTVGVELNVQHIAATPIGMEVRFESELIEIDGRMLLFEVRAYDDAGLCGKGLHKRCIVDNKRFMAKAEAKLEK